MNGYLNTTLTKRAHQIPEHKRRSLVHEIKQVIAFRGIIVSGVTYYSTTELLIPATFYAVIRTLA
jgi:hypothetical protein